MASVFHNKTLLITGGTGTFGRAFAKKLLEKDEIEKIIIFSRDELKQWELQQEDPIFSSKKARFFLGDVRDPLRLKRAFHGVDLILHAAALKQVPAAEYNPSEFIQTNIHGAMNVIDAAIDAKVEKCIALSTDKAVNPINLYGATKLCAEKLFAAAKSYVGKEHHPIFAAVRYGNVLGSRGSLLPVWQRHIERGEKELPITDETMTRFWITLNDAVLFVENCFESMRGEEIFIPKIPSFYIKDLATAYAPDMPLKSIGIRPGEKIHETLIAKEENSSCFEKEKAYAILPKDHTQYDGGRKVAENFSLISDNNPLFTQDIETIKKLI